MADAGEVANQQGDGRTAAPSRRALFQGRFRVYEAFLLHDLLGQQDNLVVEQKEPVQVVPFYQPELLPQPLRHLLRYRAIPPDGGLVAELLQVAAWGVSLGHVGVGQLVAQVGTEVEPARIGNQCTLRMPDA